MEVDDITGRFIMIGLVLALSLSCAGRAQARPMQQEHHCLALALYWEARGESRPALAITASIAEKCSLRRTHLRSAASPQSAFAPSMRWHPRRTYAEARRGARNEKQPSLASQESVSRCPSATIGPSAACEPTDAAGEAAELPFHLLTPTRFSFPFNELRTQARQPDL